MQATFLFSLLLLVARLHCIFAYIKSLSKIKIYQIKGRKQRTCRRANRKTRMMIDTCMNEQQCSFYFNIKKAGKVGRAFCFLCPGNLDLDGPGRLDSILSKFFLFISRGGEAAWQTQRASAASAPPRSGLFFVPLLLWGASTTTNEPRGRGDPSSTGGRAHIALCTSSLPLPCHCFPDPSLSSPPLLLQLRELLLPSPSPTARPID